MTRRKMNALIAIVALCLYLFGMYYQYNIARNLVGEQFENTMSNTLDAIDTALNNHDESDEVDINYTALIIASVFPHWRPYSELCYPYAFGIYDETGKLVEKSGSYIEYEDKYINVDEYFTHDLEKQFLNAFPNNDEVCAQITDMSYYLDKNNKIIPTKVTFSDLNNEKNILTLTFNEAKGDEFNIVSRFGEKVGGSFIYFNFDDLYRDRFNAKIKSNIEQEILISENTFATNDKGEYEFCGISTDYSGDGGTTGEAYIDYAYIKTFDVDEHYAVRVISSYSVPYNTIKSNAFISSLFYYTILYAIIILAVYIASNKLYKKNKFLNLTRQTFTSAAAHELKTPITIINNQCECLIQDVAPEKREEYLATIYRQNKRMSHLVTNLLQYNRLDESYRLEKEKFNLADLVNDEIEKYEAMLETKNISVYSNLDNSVINADKRLIALVVDNFISNAIKHTNNGNSIRITLIKGRLSVFNEGVPISDEDKNKIWIVFNRSVENEDDNSTGMGLAICKKILDLHKMRYGFINHKNGVEFYFE